ncbi:MAG TPA: ATP-binding protein [Candidatus Saccharimonadales bacterium]|nr:ATP-binding protein [Candidatus Saccharimonadales bacterium]
MDHVAGTTQIDSGRLMGLILTDEALANGGLDALRTIVDAQPAWSDLPVLLLTSGSVEPRLAAMATQARMEIRSLFLLDRPVRKELLLSAVQVAYTSRLKQLEVRDAAERQVHSDEALRNTEKLAVAGRLAATMAHEVNNPLEALGNLLFLIENSTGIDDVHSFARLASQELARISEIVQHTLRFHRAPAKPELTDVAELAESALALFRGKTAERRIAEHFSARRALAFCSAGEIRQALVNLIGNAIDAMPDGGHLHVRVSPVVREGAYFARLTVADTGVGIRKEIRPNLFTQFFTTKGSRGTGLGLWLTRDIVLRNRGHLRYRSSTRTPSGTVFSLYLPATPHLSVMPSPQSPVEEQRAAIGAR